MTRIHYLAGSCETWGEHEIDYILFVQKNVKHNINPSEVQDVKYFSRDDLREFLKRTDLKFTPWFKLICENFIFKWWEALLAKKLEGCIDEKTIHKP